MTIETSCAKRSVDAEDRIRAALAAKPDGVLETLAEEAGVSYRAMLDILPPGAGIAVDGEDFEAIWSDLTGWGPVLFLIHTKAGVFEIETPLSPGSFGRGYFNISGSAPLHGHLAAERCAAIYLVDRPFFGRRSCSVQFIDADGSCMFKVFVKRDAARTLDPAQLARFEALKAARQG